MRHMRFDFMSLRAKRLPGRQAGSNLLDCVVALLLAMTILLAACGKQAEKRPTGSEQPMSKSPAPFSRGPTGIPKISAPTYPQP